MAGNSYLVIVGKDDNPIYESEFGPQTQSEDLKDEPKHLNQFVVYSALDHVEDVMWGTNSMYLKIIDNFNDWSISGYILPCGVRLLLLHDPLITANGESIRGFFTDCHETFIKHMLSPFFDISSKIESKNFDTSIKDISRKWFQ